jgi:hypothetical protein
MATISIDSSDLKRMMRDLDRMQAMLPQAIARGLNEGGDKVRTQVQRALQKQTSLVRYSSVTSRVRTARAYPGGLFYSIVVSGSPPTKIGEFKTRVTTGPGGGVTAIMWGAPHRFARSFQQKDRGGLRARLGGPRFPTRSFDGPNLAKEAIKDHAAEAFFRTTATVVGPIVEKAMMKLLR